MYTTIAKILFVLYLAFMSVCVYGQEESKIQSELDYTEEYNSFVKNYNAMVEVMLNKATDAEVANISLGKEHLQYLKQARIHLDNCIEIAPEDEKLRAMLVGYKEKLDFLEE